jgi:uncharacterized protein YjbJ (UPF0337 family)
VERDAEPETFAPVGNAADEFTDEGNLHELGRDRRQLKQFKGLKEQWGKLTDDQLDTIAGKRDQLAGRIEETYGITKDQAELQVRAFEETHKDYRPTTSV